MVHITDPIELLNLPTASNEVLEALHDLQLRADAERFPADAAVPFALRQRNWRAAGACWVAWSTDRSTLVGNLWVDIPHEAHKCHTIIFNMLVLPEYRRRGIGHQFL